MEPQQPPVTGMPTNANTGPLSPLTPPGGPQTPQHYNVPSTAIESRFSAIEARLEELARMVEDALKRFETEVPVAGGALAELESIAVKWVAVRLEAELNKITAGQK